MVTDNRKYKIGSLSLCLLVQHHSVILYDPLVFPSGTLWSLDQTVPLHIGFLSFCLKLQPISTPQACWILTLRADTPDTSCSLAAHLPTGVKVVFLSLQLAPPNQYFGFGAIMLTNMWAWARSDTRHLLLLYAGIRKLCTVYRGPLATIDVRPQALCPSILWLETLEAAPSKLL